MEDDVLNVISYLTKSENSVAILFVASLLSMSVPYGFPLFGTLTIFFAILKLISKRVRIRINPGALLLFLVVFFFFLGILWNNGIVYESNKFEIINIIGYILIWILLSDLEKDDYKKLMFNIAKYSAVSTFFISFFSLYKLYTYLSGKYITFLFKGDRYPSGSSLTLDYNMFSLAMISGAVMSLAMLSKSSRITHLTFYSLTFISCITSVTFAGSRRGWVIILLLIVFLIIVAIKAVLKIRKNLTKFVKISFVAIYLIFFVSIVGHFLGINQSILKSDEIQRMKYRFETIQIQSDNTAFSNRTLRWDYAYQLFFESNHFQIFFGSGFGYLPKFADEFNVFTTTEDYPHNPFLSALLYSGIFGTLAIVLLVLWSVFNSYRNRSILGIHIFLLYLISFIFISISGNTIFAIKLFFIIVLITASIPTRERKIDSEVENTLIQSR